MLKKLQVKQPRNEEEEDFMSRHLDAVVTSTLIQKQSRHQENQRNLMQVATEITRDGGRDKRSALKL